MASLPALSRHPDQWTEVWDKEGLIHHGDMLARGLRNHDPDIALEAKIHDPRRGQREASLSPHVPKREAKDISKR